MNRHALLSLGAQQLQNSSFIKHCILETPEVFLYDIMICPEFSLFLDVFETFINNIPYESLLTRCLRIAKQRSVRSNYASMQIQINSFTTTINELIERLEKSAQYASYTFYTESFDLFPDRIALHPIYKLFKKRPELFSSTPWLKYYTSRLSKLLPM